MLAAEKIKGDVLAAQEEVLKPSRGERIFSVVVVSLGILCGLIWFTKGFLIPETTTAWFSGDPYEYATLSKMGPREAFYHTWRRSFGYPFYLSLFRALSPEANTFRLPAFLVQFLCYLASSWFLVFALRRKGMRIPSIALAFLLAHPAFAGIAGLPMSETLATAAVSVAFATAILLLNNGKLIISRAVIIGAMLGIAFCVRPQLLVFIGVLVSFIALMFGLLTYQRTRCGGRSVGKMVLFFFVSAAAFAPFVGHTVNNCYKHYHAICLIEPGLASRAMKESLSNRSNRVWYSFLPAPHTAVMCVDTRSVQRNHYALPDCRAHPLEGLLMCYKVYWRKFPGILGEKLLGMLDNRHIHPYANKETTILESTVIRAWSAVGLVGLLLVCLLWIFSLFQGRGLEKSYLLFPLVLIGIQIHLHPEARYIYPVLPMLFVCGLSALVVNPFPRRWQMAIFLLCSAVVVRTYVVKVSLWDSEIIEPLCRTEVEFKP